MEVLSEVLGTALVLAVAYICRLRFKLAVEQEVNGRLKAELRKFGRVAILLTTGEVAFVAAQDVEIETLSNGVAAALLDARRLDSARAQYTRYFHYVGLEEWELPAARRQMNAHVAHLSRSASQDPPLRKVSKWVDSLYLPDLILTIRDQNELNRVVVAFGDLAEARIKDGELVTSSSDQFYHVYSVDYDNVDPTSNKFHKGKFFIPRGATWLGPQAIDELQLLCHSRTPIVSALWFYSKTAIQFQQDGHGYYDFIGVDKRVESFFKIGDVNIKKEEELRLQQAAVLGESGIAIHNRGVRLGAARTGWHFFTEDYNTSVGRQNVINNLNVKTIPPHGDANEHYTLDANGLFKMYLNNSDGERQDFVPQTIALDDARFIGPGDNDRNIHCYMSCVRCHREGLRPIDDYARKVFQDKMWLGSPDRREYEDLRDLYTRDMKFEVNMTLQRYERALKKVSGWTPEQFADATRWFYNRYRRPVTRTQAALELGVSEAVLVERLNHYNRMPEFVLAPTLAGFIKPEPVPMARDHFEEFYVVLQTFVMPRDVVWVVPEDKRRMPPWKIPRGAPVPGADAVPDQYLPIIPPEQGVHN